MVVNVLSKFLRRAGIGRDSITMLDLEYSTERGSVEVEDFSKNDILSGTYSSPKLYIEDGIKPQIPIIGIGGCGTRIVEQISNRMSNYGLNYPLMVVDTDEKSIASSSASHKYQFPNIASGTSKQYRVGATIANTNKDEFMNQVNSYIESVQEIYKHEIVFLIMGSGGTGIGVGTELAKWLIEIGKRPVPILIMPGKEENSRIRFTAAAGIYKFSYGPREQSLKLATLLINNERFLEKNNRASLTSILTAINERVGSTIADLVISSEMRSDGYSADLNEFLEIFRNIKGIGTISFLHTGKDYTNLSEFLGESNFSKSLPMDIDPYSATRGYLFIQASADLVTARHYRDTMMKFNNSDIFPKFVEIGEKGVNFTVRGIFTGVKYPPQVEEIMRMALDARIKLLNQEEDNLSDGRQNVKIDRLTGDEEIEVTTGGEKTNL